MKIFAVVALALLSTAAIAQERSFTATLTEADWNYVAGVLGKRPFEESQRVMNAIGSQIQSQMSAQLAEQQKAMSALADKRKQDEEAAKAAAPPQPTEPQK